MFVFLFFCVLLVLLSSKHVVESRRRTFRLFFRPRISMSGMVIRPAQIPCLSSLASLTPVTHHDSFVTTPIIKNKKQYCQVVWFECSVLFRFRFFSARSPPPLMCCSWLVTYCIRTFIPNYLFFNIGLDLVMPSSCHTSHPRRSLVLQLFHPSLALFFFRGWAVCDVTAGATVFFPLSSEFQQQLRSYW